MVDQSALHNFDVIKEQHREAHHMVDAIAHKIKSIINDSAVPASIDNNSGKKTVRFSEYLERRSCSTKRRNSKLSAEEERAANNRKKRLEALKGIDKTISTLQELRFLVANREDVTTSLNIESSLQKIESTAKKCVTDFNVQSTQVSEYQLSSPCKVVDPIDTTLSTS